MFHGPREEVLPFFTGLGFRLPERKGIADFLQEVTSSKDQQVDPYPFMSQVHDPKQACIMVARLAKRRPPCSCCAVASGLAFPAADISSSCKFNPKISFCCPCLPQQYWADTSRPYEFVPVAKFAAAFAASPRGRALAAAAKERFVPSKACTEMDPLVRTRCVLYLSLQLSVAVYLGFKEFHTFIELQ